ncbi:MAG: hypothetical protein ABIB61_01830 [Candidatus Shapirobacteria bacterium]
MGKSRSIQEETSDSGKTKNLSAQEEKNQAETEAQEALTPAQKGARTRRRRAAEKEARIESLELEVSELQQKLEEANLSTQIAHDRAIRAERGAERLQIERDAALQALERLRRELDAALAAAAEEARTRKGEREMKLSIYTYLSRLALAIGLGAAIYGLTQLFARMVAPEVTKQRVGIALLFAAVAILTVAVWRSAVFVKDWKKEDSLDGAKMLRIAKGLLAYWLPGLLAGIAGMLLLVFPALSNGVWQFPVAIWACLVVVACTATMTVLDSARSEYSERALEV